MTGRGSRPRGLSARHKLLAALFPACAVASCSSLTLSGASLVLSALLLMCAGVSWRSVLPALRRVNVFFLFLLLTMPLALGPAPEGTLASLGAVHFTLPGLAAAFRAALKGNAVLLVFLALPGTEPLSMNCRALLDIGLPPKLVTLLQLVARHAAEMRREMRALFAAAALRGFTPRVDPRTWRATAYLAAMLFVRAYDKSRRVEKAMLLRGFAGLLPLLPPAEKRISSLGSVAVAASLGLSIALVAADSLLPRVLP